MTHSTYMHPVERYAASLAQHGLIINVPGKDVLRHRFDGGRSSCWFKNVSDVTPEYKDVIIQDAQMRAGEYREHARDLSWSNGRIVAFNGISLAMIGASHLVGTEAVKKAFASYADSQNPTVIQARATENAQWRCENKIAQVTKNAAIEMMETGTGHIQGTELTAQLRTCVVQETPNEVMGTQVTLFTGMVGGGCVGVLSACVGVYFLAGIFRRQAESRAYMIAARLEEIKLDVLGNADSSTIKENAVPDDRDMDQLHAAADEQWQQIVDDALIHVQGVSFGR